MKALQYFETSVRKT